MSFLALCALRRARHAWPPCQSAGSVNAPPRATPPPARALDRARRESFPACREASAGPEPHIHFILARGRVLETDAAERHVAGDGVKRGLADRDPNHVGYMGPGCAGRRPDSR